MSMAPRCTSSRLGRYVKFTLSQKRVEFYGVFVHALRFSCRQPSPSHLRQFESGRPERFGGTRLSASGVPGLMRTLLLEPVACERRDPESKGVVEAGVHYVKRY